MFKIISNNNNDENNFFLKEIKSSDLNSMSVNIGIKYKLTLSGARGYKLKYPNIIAVANGKNNISHKNLSFFLNNMRSNCAVCILRSKNLKNGQNRSGTPTVQTSP